MGDALRRLGEARRGARRTRRDARPRWPKRTTDAKEAQSGGEAIEALKSRLAEGATRRFRPGVCGRCATSASGRRGKLAEVVAALAPWRDYPEALAAVAVPDEAETAALRHRAVEMQAEWTNARKRLAELTGEVERLTIEAAEGAAADLVTDQAAAALRATREAAPGRSTARRSTDRPPTPSRRRSGAMMRRAWPASPMPAKSRRRASGRGGLRSPKRAACGRDAEVEAAEAAVDRDWPGGRWAACLSRRPRARSARLSSRRGARGVVEALDLIARLGAMKDEARRVNEVAERTPKPLPAALTAAGSATIPSSPRTR